jgi:hypothetical protein
MKFITNKSILKKTKRAGNFIQKHWNELTEDKKQLLIIAMWEGIIPTNLPKHLQPFKKTLQELAARGCEGQAWKKVIEETKNFIIDSKVLNEKELTIKYKKYLKELHDTNYKEYDWMTTEDLMFNIDARNAITRLDLEFIEKRILTDLEQSKQRAWIRHQNKWSGISLAKV